MTCSVEGSNGVIFVRIEPSPSAGGANTCPSTLMVMDMKRLTYAENRAAALRWDRTHKQWDARNRGLPIEEWDQ